MENKLVGNKVVRTTTETLPRYKVIKTDVDFDFLKQDSRGFFIDKDIHICLPKYNVLHEVNISRESDTPMKDFKEYITKHYNKEYNFYWIREFNHSGSSFTLAETPHIKTDAFTAYNWDTSNVGFVAIPKNSKITPETVGNMITDLWEGTIYEYAVVDNLTNDYVDNWEFWLNTTTQEEYKQMVKYFKDTYDIDME